MANAAGYRKYGFKYDDLLVEERPDVQRALLRLSPHEKYDRAFRLKRASQASVQHAPYLEKNGRKQQKILDTFGHMSWMLSKKIMKGTMWDTIVIERK